MEIRILRNIILGLLGLALLTAVVLQGFDPIIVVSVELLLMATLFAVLWCSYDRWLHIPSTPISIMLTLMWIWMGISAAISPSRFLSLYGFFLLSGSIFIYWVTTLLPTQTYESFWKLLRILLIALGLFLVMYVFVQVLHDSVDPSAFFVQKNSLGAFMNILTLPLVAYYLTISPGWQKKILIPVLFLLFFAICITNSYGVALGFCLGFVCILFFTRKVSSRQDREVLLLLVLLAFFLDRVFVAQGLVPTSLMMHASPRLVIWAASWHLLQSRPWYGTGIYNFFFHYASYMPINDYSAGQYAHNDYLQFWIELGYPGLVLIIGLIAAVSYTFIRWLKMVGIKAQNRIEGVGLFAGLMAVAVHSFVTYNFYILPTVLLFGLVLARFDHIVNLGTKRSFLLRPANIMTSKGFRLIVLSIFLVVGAWLSLMLASQLYYRQGSKLLAQGKLLIAEPALNKAAKLYDTCDIEFSRARLYALLLTSTTGLPQADRRKLFALALGDIKQANELNPLRAIAAVRAELIQSSPDIVGPDWLQLAINNYQIALAKNPRLMAIRMQYIKLLLNNYRYKLAEKALSNGILYSLSKPLLRDFFAHILVALQNKHKRQF